MIYRSYLSLKDIMIELYYKYRDNIQINVIFPSQGFTMKGGWCRIKFTKPAAFPYRMNHFHAVGHIPIDWLPIEYFLLKNQEHYNDGGHIPNM